MARFTLPRDVYHGEKAQLEALKTFTGKKAMVLCRRRLHEALWLPGQDRSGYLKEAGMEVETI